MRELSSKIRSFLDTTGLSWEIRRGKKHLQLYVEGRIVLVFSRGHASGYHEANSLATVKRTLRERSLLQT